MVEMTKTRIRCRLFAGIALGICCIGGCLTNSVMAQTESGEAATANPNQAPPKASQISGPRTPDWVPLPPKHAQFLDEVLRYWEQHTSKIQRFRCRFKRWEYDQVFGPGENQAKTYADGEIKYVAPDKGLFKVDKLMAFTRDNQDPEGRFVEQPELADHWLCDGKAIFRFDYQRKVLTEHRLPPEMHGKAITHGPLPFLFGANAADIKRRYWLRVITPEDRTQGPDREYWLEAIPKSQVDATDYRAIHIMIDGKDFLPKGMVLFGRTGGNRQSFVFDNRDVNFNILAEKINIFHRQFYEPKLPSSDWKKVIHGAEQARR